MQRIRNQPNLHRNLIVFVVYAFCVFSAQLLDYSNRLQIGQKRITALETTNQALREKIVELENGQKANTEPLTKIVEKIAKDEGVTVPLSYYTETDWNMILKKLEGKKNKES